MGFPFYSGRGTYRTRVDLSDDVVGRPVLLDVPMRDDVVDVEVNGVSVGVRMWDPYVVELTGRLHPGENEFAFRVANTPANLMSAQVRPSGLAGVPRLEFDRSFAPFAASTRSA